MNNPIPVADLTAALAAIDQARKDQDMTRADLAAFTPGTSGSQVTEWLNGKHQPGSAKLFALAKTLGLRWALIPMIENEDG